MVPGSFPTVRWPGRKRGHLPTSDAEVKNDWSLPLLPYIPSWRGHVVPFRYDLDELNCRQRSADVGLSVTSECYCRCQMPVHCPVVYWLFVFCDRSQLML